MNSKSKGSRSELRICKILNEKFETEEFQRTPGSGSFGTRGMGKFSKEAQAQLSGDAICPSNWLFSLENKAGYDLDPLKLFYAQTSEKSKESGDLKTFREFCEQSSSDALKVAGRVPCVIYTKNRCETVLMVPIENHIRAAEILNLLQKNTLTSLCFTIDNKHEQWQRWAMFNFIDFLNAFDRSFFFEGKEEENQQV